MKEQGLIAACLGIRLLYRDKRYIVDDGEQQRRYWFAHNAANGFSEAVGDALRRRINAAGIAYPSPADLAEAEEGYEEYAWWQEILKSKERETAKRDS